MRQSNISDLPKSVREHIRTKERRKHQARITRIYDQAAASKMYQKLIKSLLDHSSRRTYGCITRVRDANKLAMKRMRDKLNDRG